MDNSAIIRKHLLRKVYTQRDVDLNHLRESHLNLRENSSKDGNISHLSMDYRKAKSKQKNIIKLNSTIQRKRKDIYLEPLLNNKISLCYKLILKNKKELITLKEDNKLGDLKIMIFKMPRLLLII